MADLAQVRALVGAASCGSVSLSELAEAMNIHLTRASRLCDRLVVNGLIDRAGDPSNRRQLTLTLTADGQRVVNRVMQRREVIEPILARMEQQMSPPRRAELVSLLQEFELSTGLTSVKQGDYKLASGDIFGGNAFLPVLFLLAVLVSGKAVLPNAHASDIYLTGLGGLLTIIYMAGLLFHPAKEHARLGIDSIAVLVVYVIGVVGLITLPQ